MSIFSAALQTGLNALQIALDADILAKLERHWRLVVKYNQKFNLTAIRDDAEAAVKHYLDCLLLLPHLREFMAGGHIAGGHGSPPLQAADIGSGAGFPGLVLAMACSGDTCSGDTCSGGACSGGACPDSQWLLLEASHKKCAFLEHCIAELEINNARTLPLRAEQAGHDACLRGAQNLVTARAVSNLAVLAEYAAPLLQEGGMLAALKGPALAEEEQAAANALKVLGLNPAGRQEFTLPCTISAGTTSAGTTSAGGDTRLIGWYQKTAPTPEKYPRRAGMPEKRPL